MNVTKDYDLEDGEIEDDENEENKINDIIETTKLKSNTLTFNIIKSYDKVELKQEQSFREELVEDDWASKVENAIASALKKDDIETLLPLLPTKSDFSKNQINNKSYYDDRCKLRSSKKQRDNEREKGKKRHYSVLEIKKSEEELDDYEMLYIRGGSPYKNSTVIRYEESYESSYSCSSYDSYEDRHERRRIKERHRRLQRKDVGRQAIRNDNKRPKIRHGGHVCDSDIEDIHHELKPNRIMELCKFYLIKRCVKRDRCLYMHSDFPCKFYYLGVKCVMKDNCIFTHGKPLSDSLRTTLIKHLETAPQELLGNFPRLKRDILIEMMDTTNVSLMSYYGLKPLPISSDNGQQQQPKQQLQEQKQQQSLLHTTLSDISNNNDNNINTNLLQQINSIPLMCDGKNKNNNKIPSLLEIKCLDENIIYKHNIMDNPRRTRWCTKTTATSPSPSVSATLSVSASLSSTNPSNTDYLSLKNLTGIITTIQIQKLESIGIENLAQINQLTVEQLNDLGLSINQIRCIKLNALNIQKLGLPTIIRSPSPVIASVIVKPTQLITINAKAKQLNNNNNNNNCNIIGTGDKDLDMRIINPINPQINSTIDISLGMQDVDMRVLPTINKHSTILQQSRLKTSQLLRTQFFDNPKDDEISSDRLQLSATLSTTINKQSSNEPSIIDYNKFMTNPKKLIVVDYTQYLNDSNIENMIDSMSNDSSDDQNKLKIKSDNDDDDNINYNDNNIMRVNSIHEDESEL